jgi:hypothetical protein
VEYACDALFDFGRLADAGSAYLKAILSARARQPGYMLACCRDLYIHHFGSRIFAQGAPTAGEAMA